MKISTQLFSKLFFVAALTQNAMQSAESKTLVNDLGNLSHQLEQLACQSGKFLAQLNLPQTICILDNGINNTAPSRKELENFAKETCIEVVQLVVAWQDLSVESFIKEQGFINAMIENLLGFKTKDSILTCMHKNEENKKLRTALEAHKKQLSASVLADSLGGGYASCGYHTILNLNTLCSAFEENNAKERSEKLKSLTDLVEVNTLFGLTNIITSLNKFSSPQFGALWRDTILKERAKYPDYADYKGEWVSSAALRILIGMYSLLETPGSMSLTFHDKDIETQKITKSSAKKVKEEYTSYQEERLKRNPDYVPSKRCAFMVNTDHSHWYGIFVTLDTTPRLCIIVDSKNSPRYGDYALAEILKGLFSESAQKITSALGRNFKYKRDKELDDEIYKWEALDALADIMNLETLQGAIKEWQKTGFWNDKTMEAIFTGYAVFEPARKKFKNNYTNFKEALQKIKRGTKMELAANVINPMKILF